LFWIFDVFVLLDSKKLTEEKRTNLAKIIEANKDWIGWAVYVISPQDISTNMFKRYYENLFYEKPLINSFE
jgi:ribonuclease HII